MRKRKFRGELLAGHKENAVEVPFDPAKQWAIAPRALWRGRRGHPVTVTVNGFSFQSSIVPRQKKFYLLIDAEAKQAAKLSAEVEFEISVEPYVD